MLDVRLHCMEKKNHMAIIWTFLHHNYIFFLKTSWNHGDVTFVGVCTKHVFISGEQNKSTSLQFYQTFYLYQKQMADSAIWQYCNFDNIWINFAAPVSWKICWAAVVKEDSLVKTLVKYIFISLRSLKKCRGLVKLGIARIKVQGLSNICHCGFYVSLVLSKYDYFMLLGTTQMELIQFNNSSL